MERVDWDSEQLLKLMAADLRGPLVAIKLLAESEDGVLSKDLLVQTTLALKTVEAIELLCLIDKNQTELRLEPIHLGSVITEVIGNYDFVCRSTGIDTETTVSPGLKPVLVNRNILKIALSSVLQTLIGMMPERGLISCDIVKKGSSVRLNFLSPQVKSEDTKILTVSNYSSQPIKTMAGPAFNFIAAQVLMRLIGAKLTSAKKHDMSGFGVTLKSIDQLQFLDI